MAGIDDAQDRYIEARNQAEEFEANMDMAEYDEDKAKEKLSEIKKQSHYTKKR